MSEQLDDTSHMPGARTVAVAALGLALVAGCSRGSGNAAPETPSRTPAATASAQSPTASAEPSTVAEPLLADPTLLADAYPQLPEPVAQASKAIVRLNLLTEQRTEEVDAHGQVQRTYGGMQFHGSASIVKRNGRYVLVSAGHVIDGEGMDTHCGDIGISYQEGTSHSVDKAEKVSANYGPTALPGYGPDIGVIEPTQPADAAFPMPLSTTPPLAGDVGFVMGYHDPFPGEAERDPSYADMSSPFVSDGIILGTSGGYAYLLQGSGRTFTDGAKVAKSGSGDSGNGVHNVEKYTREFGVPVPANPEKYQITVAQLIDASKVSSLTHAADASTVCITLPPRVVHK
jgi:hypothetical protein